jgi:signal transduction histidine kinase
MSERASGWPFDLDTALSDLIRQLRGIMPSDSGGVVLYDPQTALLVPRAVWGTGARDPVSLALGEGIVGEVAARQRPERIDDMRADPRCVFIDPESRSELAVPVALGGTLWGVLNVESRQPRAFDDHDVAIAEALAEQLARLLAAGRDVVALAAQRDDLIDQMEARRRDTDALQRLATITSATVNLDEMLTHAVRETAELLDCEGAQLWLPNHVAYVLEVHEPSLYGSAQAWPRGPWPLDGMGYLAHVYHTGTVHVTLRDSADLPLDCRHALDCPLNTRNRTLGVLRLANQRVGLFTEAQIEIAQVIANQIAVSLGSAQRFAAERRRAEMMSQINRVSQELYATLDPQQLLDKAAQLIRAMLDQDAVYLFLVERDLVRLRATSLREEALALPAAYAIPLGEGVVGRAIRVAEGQIVPDTRQDEDCWLWRERRIQSCLAVPIRQGEQVIGAIDVVSAQLNAFGELDRDALETLGTQIGIALENARLYDQIQRRLLEQGVVHQIGQDLTAILDFRALCETIVQRMNRALRASGCAVAIYEPQHATVRIEADHRLPEDHQAPNSPLLTGAYLALDDHPALAGAIRARQPVTVYRADPRASPEAQTLLEELGNHSQLVVPMVVGERVLGAVDWTDRTPGRVFTPEDIQLARTLVAQAAVAVDNALLFRELEERAAQLAEANRLRSQFLAVISHELRTPMNSIIGFSETLMEGLYGDLNERQSSRLDRIRQNGYQLLALIDDLLDLSKIDAGRMQLDLGAVSAHESLLTVAQTLGARATEKGLALSIQVDDDLPRVKADPQRLGQIIANLLSNAIKFTREGGITVTCETVNRQGRRYVQTRVADTGIGISHADQDYIFDEFRQVDSSSTRAYGGTGMGLAITRRLVELMGGTIWVESEPGKGSVFTFTLPVAENGK